jgi:multidrug resistance efflux pump
MSEERSMRRWIVVGIAAVAVTAALVLLGSGWLSAGSGSGASPTPLPPVPPSDRVVAEARAVPATSAAASAAVPGTVARVPVAEGDRVAAGAVLVELDATSAEAEIAAAQAALDAAAARSEQAAAAAKQATAEVNRAAAGVQAARAGRDQLPSGASSARRRQADAEVNAAVAGLEAARAGATGAAAAAKAADADEARAAAALDGTRAAADRLTISAPISGTVAGVAVAVGDVVAAGPPLVRIAGDGGWVFETTDVTQDEVAAIAVGAAATVTLDGFAETAIAGRVANITVIGEDRQGDVVFTVRVEPDGAVPDGVRWNMQASIEIATTR